MTPKRFNLILLAILGVLICGGGAAYYFGANLVSAKTTELQQHLNDVQMAQQKLDDLGLLKIQYDSVQNLLPSLDEALPQAKKQSELVLQTRKLADSSGVSVKSISFSGTSGSPSSTSQTTPDKDSGALGLQMAFDATGSYAQMQSFLQSLERLGRLNTVDNVSITRDDKTQQITANFTIRPFIKP